MAVGGADDVGGDLRRRKELVEPGEGRAFGPGRAQPVGDVLVQSCLDRQAFGLTFDHVPGPGAEAGQQPFDSRGGDVLEPLGGQEGAQPRDGRRRDLLVEDRLERVAVPGVLGPPPDHADRLSLDEVGQGPDAARPVTAVLGRELDDAEPGAIVGVEDPEHLADELVVAEEPRGHPSARAVPDGSLAWSPAGTDRGCQGWSSWTCSSRRVASHTA